MNSKRVVIVVNKWWELDPVMFCLTSKYLRKDIPWPIFKDHPRPRRNPKKPEPPEPAKPRAIFSFPFAEAEIWCVSDLIEHLPDESKYQSSTERKAEVIGQIFAEPADLCIAVGTAAAGDARSLNGSAVIGTQCFMHNSKPNGANPDSNWQAGPFDEILRSALTEGEFDSITRFEIPLTQKISSTLFAPPNAPSASLSILCDYEAVAVGNLNVSNYQEYDTTDRETLKTFNEKAPEALLGSLETTHGLIRALGHPRFIFISGIVNRLLHFHEDVDPARYAQNTVGAHNAGIVLSALLCRLHHLY